MRRLILGLAICGLTAGAAEAQTTLWHPRPAAPAAAPAPSAGAPAASNASAAAAKDPAPAAKDPAPAVTAAYGMVLAKPSANLARDIQSRDFKIHDIISIIVQVAANSSTDEQLSSERKSDKQQFDINQYMTLVHRQGLAFDLKGHQPQDLAINMDSDRKTDNQGASDRSDTLRTRIAAEITDIKPNGNIVLEARHQFIKQGEKTTITLTGVVRPQDVLPDNTIFSYNVADADIRYESEGPITDASRRGWLSKIFDKIMPF
jgi:flagellar L-ring protein FlgH